MHAHLEAEFLLVADARELLDPARGNGRLLFDYLEIVGHHQNVVKVVALAGVIKDTDDVRHVCFLVFFEEIIAQIK